MDASLLNAETTAIVGAHASAYIGRGHLDRQRAQRLMADLGVDALLLLGPNSIVYATGVHPGNVTQFRRAGAAFLLIPADPAEPPSAIIGDYYLPAFVAGSGIEDTRPFPIWVETADISPFAGETVPLRQKLAMAADARRPLRPAVFDRQTTLGMLCDLLKQKGLASAHLAIEAHCLSPDDGAAFEQACPNVRWVDGDPMVVRLRMIKTHAELDKLRMAAAAAETGIGHTLNALAAGMDGAEVADIWRAAALDHARTASPRARLDTWSSMMIGPAAYGRGNPIERGDVVKLDVGVVIDGYSSDSARTFVFGSAGDDLLDLFKTMEEAHCAAVEALSPGVPLRDIYWAAMTVMHRSGFEGYKRGHLGHGLGASYFTEEWPFVSADEDQLVLPGMVLAIEVPWYVRGLGALMIEDQFVISDRGAERAWTLPRGLVSI